MPTLTRHLPAFTRQRKVFSQALLSALAAMALTACGGGGADTETAMLTAQAAGMENNTEDSTDSSRDRAASAATVTMTKVSFTNADGTTITGFLFKDPNATPRNAAVVMMHGCSGVWSNGKISTEPQPAINTLSHIHKRWGQNLAAAGYVGLLVDSFTERALTNECGNGSAGLNEATVRPKDALAGRAWLVANGHVASDRIALMGWSNGGSAVLATMDQTNEGSAGSKPFREAFSFYPGCGLINEFGGNASTTDKTTWLPYAPVTIHHAATDPLYTSGQCENRKSTAIALGASSATGNAVAMTVYASARHSFDQIDISKALSAPYTQADKDAQIAADASVMDRLSTVFGQ